VSRIREEVSLAQDPQDRVAHPLGLPLILGWYLQGVGLALAQAATLKVIAADRLEIRNDNGEEPVILTGNPVRRGEDRGAEGGL